MYLEQKNTEKLGIHVHCSTKVVDWWQLCHGETRSYHGHSSVPSGSCKAVIGGAGHVTLHGKWEKGSLTFSNPAKWPPKDNFHYLTDISIKVNIHRVVKELNIVVQYMIYATLVNSFLGIFVHSFWSSFREFILKFIVFKLHFTLFLLCCILWIYNRDIWEHVKLNAAIQ